MYVRTVADSPVAMSRERRSTDGGSPYSPLGTPQESAFERSARRWSCSDDRTGSRFQREQPIVTSLFDRLQVIPRRFFYLPAVRGFSGEEVPPANFINEVRQFGTSERLIKLERWLLTVGVSEVLNRVFESIEKGEKVPQLEYEAAPDGSYVSCERDVDVRALAVLYGSECPAAYGACRLEASQFWYAKRIGWANDASPKYTYA